tara:strand:+ start:119362 stop:120426 length:1065 start_codon:yes stop_codon:yes gene_type:complete
MKKVRILSLDGGGMRGIIPATVLEYVEKKIIEKTGNPDARLADYFDFVAGTSTGGILSAFYLTPAKVNNDGPSSRFKASEALEFYSKDGYKIFNESKKWSWFGLRQLFNAAKYSPKELERILQEQFNNLKLSDLLKPCIITTYDMSSKSSFFFSSREPVAKQREFYVKDVLRSTSAAPTYFPPAFIHNLKTLDKTMVNIDGGVFANNPALCAYSECRNTKFKQVEFPGASDMLIVSIGTGGGQFKLPNVPESNKWGILKWATCIPDIMMDGSVDTVSYQMKNIFDTVRENGMLNYKRIDVPKDKRSYSSDMADASPKNVAALKAAGEEALKDALKDKEGEHSLDQIIDLLISDN